MKILIVDDDPTIRKYVARALRGDAEVTEAKDQETGNRLFSEGQFDAVLVDVNLGADNGIELAIRFRDLDPQLIVIVISGDPANEDKARQTGLGEFLFKPFSVGELKRRLGITRF